MWAVAAQPRAGETPMIPTPSVDSDIARADGRVGPCLVDGRLVWTLCVCTFTPLEPEDRVDEDDRDTRGDDLMIDDQDLVHGAVDPVGGLGASILQGEGVFVDPAEAFLEVRHDL